MNKSDIRSLVKEEIKNIIQETEKDYTVEYWFRRNDDMDFDHITVKASSPTEALSKAKEQLDIKLEKIEQQEVPVEITRISNPESNPEVIVEAPKSTAIPIISPRVNEPKEPVKEPFIVTC